MLALNAGMRDAEIRNLTWSQTDFEKSSLGWDAARQMQDAPFL
jgi:integrase